MSEESSEDLSKSDNDLGLTGDPPPVQPGKIFVYYGAWCMDVPDDTTSLIEVANTLIAALPQDGVPVQRVLLLSQNLWQQGRFLKEMRYLTLLDLGEREEMLKALRRGYDQAKKYFP
jgi:hypothetical protein